MPPEPAAGFVDPSSILTYGGASFAVWVVSATARKIIGRETLIVPVVLAFVTGFAIAISQEALGAPLEWLVAVVNSCILFCTATGVNETAAGMRGGAEPGPAGVAGEEEPGVKLVGSWFS